MLTVDEVQELPAADLTVLVSLLHDLAGGERPVVVVLAGPPATPERSMAAGSFAERFAHQRLRPTPEAATAALLTPAQERQVTWSVGAADLALSPSHGAPAPALRRRRPARHGPRARRPAWRSSRPGRGCARASTGSGRASTAVAGPAPSRPWSTAGGGAGPRPAGLPCRASRRSCAPRTVPAAQRSTADRPQRRRRRLLRPRTTQARPPSGDMTMTAVHTGLGSRRGAGSRSRSARHQAANPAAGTSPRGRRSLTVGLLLDVGGASVRPPAAQRRSAAAHAAQEGPQRRPRAAICRRAASHRPHVPTTRAAAATASEPQATQPSRPTS